VATNREILSGDAPMTTHVSR